MSYFSTALIDLPLLVPRQCSAMSRTMPGDSPSAAPAVPSAASWYSSLMNASKKATASPTALSTYARCCTEMRESPAWSRSWSAARRVKCRADHRC
jgi:hypothetical protein